MQFSSTEEFEKCVRNFIQETAREIIGNKWNYLFEEFVWSWSEKSYKKTIKAIKNHFEGTAMKCAIDVVIN